MLASCKSVFFGRTSAGKARIHEPKMSSGLRKLQVVASFGFLMLTVIGVGCDGFFVDPTLVSLSVQTLQSTSLINVGNTVQLQATGTYDDGSHKNLTGHATWSVTTNPDFVTVSPGGLVTATNSLLMD